MARAAVAQQVKSLCRELGPVHRAVVAGALLYRRFAH